jgi:hypothetical protein
MKKLNKIKLNEEDFKLINNKEKSIIKGGGDEYYCIPFKGKIYTCANYELGCDGGFTYGDCGQLNITCPSNFYIKPKEYN